MNFISINIVIPIIFLLCLLSLGSCHSKEHLKAISNSQNTEGHLKQIMQNIYWSFDTEPYESKEKFIVELEKYNKEITSEEFTIDLESATIPSDRVVIQYFYFDDKGEEVEPDFLLEADNGVSFTQDELLYKVHNLVCEKLEGQNHHFFEGFTLWEGEHPNYPDVPLYFLRQGS